MTMSPAMKSTDETALKDPWFDIYFWIPLFPRF